jgi:hypothetical protein
VSAKLIPEICSKQSAAAAGWQYVAGELQPQIDIHKAVSRLHFFSLWWDWNCIAFEFRIFVSFSPLMRQWQNYSSDTNTRTGCWRTNTKSIKTETLLHLNLGNFIHLFFLFLFIIFLSSICLSNACLAHCWLLHYLSLFISSALFLFFFVFPFSLPSLLSLSSHPSILDIIIVIIIS